MLNEFTLESKLIRDDFDGRKGNSVWNVTVSRNGHSYSSEYSMGAAHRHYPNGAPINLKYRNLTVYDLNELKRSKPDKPSLEDVLYCLTMDAQPVANTSCFEDWCKDLGYDSDSREAERVYNECVRTYLALRQFCDLDELSELFQDY